jgi:hypothetical protein
MSDHRKPPAQSTGRTDRLRMPDELNFSIETTTMRLKSLKLRRAEAADKALDAHMRVQEPVKAPPPAAPDVPAGRVRHDERGMAVWDWAAAAGETAALSATNVMRKLDVSGLSIEQTQRSLKALEPEVREPAGSDPYNQHRSQPGDPFKRNSAAGSDPYNRATPPAASSRRPPVKAPVSAAPEKKPTGSVLDQLLGKKK